MTLPANDASKIFNRTSFITLNNSRLFTAKTGGSEMTKPEHDSTIGVDGLTPYQRWQKSDAPFKAECHRGLCISWGPIDCAGCRQYYSKIGTVASLLKAAIFSEITLIAFVGLAAAYPITATTFELFPFSIFCGVPFFLLRMWGVLPLYFDLILAFVFYVIWEDRNMVAYD